MRGGAANPVRLRYTKLGKVRWISHRDVARAFERAFRVAQLPLAFTEGFSPRPKVSFGLALSTGHESDAEYVDLVLAEDGRPRDACPQLLTAALPAGIDVVGAVALADRAPALQEAVTCVEWRVEVAHNDLTAVDPAQLAHAGRRRAGRYPHSPTTKRRKGRDVIEDVRPVIRRITVCDEVSTLDARRHRDGNVNPTARREAGGSARCNRRLHRQFAARRTHQWIERNGARQEPLDADTRPRVPEACAS